MAQGKTVGFFNNYAAISNYMFYTGDSAVYLSTPDYRFCQYDLWNYQSFAEGKSVMAIQSEHMNPPNLTKMTTGETKGYIIINNFQSLKDLNIELNNVTKNTSDYVFNITLINNNPFPIFTNHVSQPALVLEQNKNEIYSILLDRLTNISEIKPNEEVACKFSISEKLISKKFVVVLYTVTKDNVKGEMISAKMKLHLN